MHAEPRGLPSSRDKSVTNDEVYVRRIITHFTLACAADSRFTAAPPLVSQGSVGTVINDPYTGAKTTRIT